MQSVVLPAETDVKELYLAAVLDAPGDAAYLIPPAAASGDRRRLFSKMADERPLFSVYCNFEVEHQDSSTRTY